MKRRGLILAGGGQRHEVGAPHHRRQQAAGAGVRQADDRLPAQHPDAGGHLRAAGITTPTDQPAFERLLGTDPAGAWRSAMRCSPAPTGWPRRS